MLPTLAAPTDNPRTVRPRARTSSTSKPASGRVRGPRAWSLLDRQTVDAVLFDSAAWFALDAHNRRVPRVVVTSMEAGLGLIGKGPVASIVGRLRPGVIVVDIDLPGIDGHAAAEVISMWTGRCGLWSLVRPLGGAEGRTHVFVLAGDREEQLRERVTAWRTQMAVSSPYLQVRTYVRPLSAPHRQGADTTPYGQPTTLINELRTKMAKRPLISQHGQPEAATATRGDLTSSVGTTKPTPARSAPWPNTSGAGRASAAHTLSPNPRPSLLPTAPSPSRPLPRRDLPAVWGRYLTDGIRPRIGGSDTTGRSNYEAILTGHLLRAGHTHESAWTAISSSDPAAMTKAKTRGHHWWTTTMWKRAVTDNQALVASRPKRGTLEVNDSSVAAAVRRAEHALTSLAWSATPRRRPSLLLVGHHVLDRVRRTGQLRVPVPERDLHEDTGLDRRTIRHALRGLHERLGTLHTDCLQRRPSGRASSSYEFEIVAVEGGGRRTAPPSFHHPPPPGTWAVLPRSCHQLWRALRTAPAHGLDLETLMVAAILTDRPDLAASRSQTRSALSALSALARAGLATCDHQGQWASTPQCHRDHARLAATRYGELHRVVILERLTYRAAGASDWDIARAAARKAQQAKQKAWWGGLTGHERAVRREARRTVFAALSAPEQEQAKARWATRDPARTRSRRSICRTSAPPADRLAPSSLQPAFHR